MKLIKYKVIKQKKQVCREGQCQTLELLVCNTANTSRNATYPYLESGNIKYFFLNNGEKYIIQALGFKTVNRIRSYKWHNSKKQN